MSTITFRRFHQICKTLFQRNHNPWRPSTQWACSLLVVDEGRWVTYGYIDQYDSFVLELVLRFDEDYVEILPVLEPDAQIRYQMTEPFFATEEIEDIWYRKYQVLPSFFAFFLELTKFSEKEGLDT